MNKLIFCITLFVPFSVSAVEKVLEIDPSFNWVEKDLPLEAMKHFEATGTLLLDYSVSEASGVLATAIQSPLETENKHSTTSFMTGVKEGIEAKGGIIDKIERTNIKKFPAYRITGEATSTSFVNYVIFTSDHSLLIGFTRIGVQANEATILDYFTRIRFTGGISPGSVDAYDRTLSAYRSGQWIGRILFILLTIGVLACFVITTKWAWRKLKRRNANTN
ncbi:hypothetical protein IEN85_18730 [Pelagicoccus sp. NFK12]|uniref:Uncharacterized protein n=1 Tax=Pelagicoccus enzymogenes TaxID=2773457 RepID=A0A927IJ67_9BACT|nr:hypothetical protein [Pelagicoccus enzymogenes]MBD5781544.1 hypothetical protein [Pelagicoccus enzymogenes]